MTDQGLEWPPGVERTPPGERKTSQFATRDYQSPRGLAECYSEAQDEITRLGGQDLRIDMDRPLRQDGLPYASSKEPEDPGVVVYWRMSGQGYCVACDQYDRNACNLWAVVKTLRAMRGIDRWGAVSTEQAFKGVERIPAHGGGPVDPNAWVGERSPYDVLGVEPDAAYGVLKAAARREKRKYHPDLSLREDAEDRFKEVLAACEALGL